MASLTAGAGCLGPRLFAGEIYTAQHFYLAGAGAYQKQVLDAIAKAIQARGPRDMRVSVAQAQGPMGASPRDVIAVRWSIGYGYVVCFAPGTDLFVSVRTNFAPGCLARVFHPFGQLEPNIFGLDDLNMLALCTVRTVQEQLDVLQLSYITGGLEK